MAGIVTYGDGLRRVEFVPAKGERAKIIRLGRVTMRAAEAFRAKVAEIVADKAQGRPHQREVCEWLSSLPAATLRRLQLVGLADAGVGQTRTTLDELLTAYDAAADVKPATRVRMKQAADGLRKHFGGHRVASSIGTADADGWRAGLKAAGYAVATISRTVRYARAFFRWAGRRGMVAANPFAELATGSQVNKDRAFFVTREAAAAVLDACPCNEWRLLFALSRFGALRVPSEALALTWDCIDWGRNRMRIVSPKTAHHAHGAERLIPIFPEVLPFLREAFEQAEPGDTLVIRRYRGGVNLNPQLRRIIRRAGLTPWPRTWHNCRASRQTELAADYPLHVACSWAGNSAKIAAAHYLTVRDADFDKATGAEKSAVNGADYCVLPPSNAVDKVAADVAETPEIIGFVDAVQGGATTVQTPNWAEADLNRRHTDFQSVALPTELPARPFVPVAGGWRPSGGLSWRGAGGPGLGTSRLQRRGGRIGRLAGLVKGSNSALSRGWGWPGMPRILQRAAAVFRGRLVDLLGCTGRAAVRRIATRAARGPVAASAGDRRRRVRRSRFRRHWPARPGSCHRAPATP